MTDTILTFANSLRISVPVLLDQLMHAGIFNKTAQSLMSASDKNKLLEYLRVSHGRPPNRPEKDSSIERLIVAGYLSKKSLKGLKNDRDVLNPELLLNWAQHAVRAAYSNSNEKIAQALIELLPKQLQQSLAEWFGAMGMPHTRLAYPLDGLPNSLWLISLPPNRKLQAKIFEKSIEHPFTLTKIDPQKTQISERPFFDDREIDEHGQSVRAYQGGATGLKR